MTEERARVRKMGIVIGAMDTGQRRLTNVNQP